MESNLAHLENGTHGICFASGLAAMDAILRMLNPGDEIVSSNDLYGGSYRLMRRVYERFGVASHFVDMCEAAEVEKAINAKTKLLWVETPTNPMLKIVDIRKMVEIAKARGIMVAVDNTFASPYLQNPLDLGADIVLHSATKYLGGHSDVVMGALIVKDAALAESLHFLQNAVGAVPSPNDCFLVLRGIKTLHLRVERACDNAVRIANYLKRHPKVSKVYYPGLKTTRSTPQPKAKCATSAP